MQRVASRSAHDLGTGGRPPHGATAGRVLVDLTHCARRTTGLERIAEELFSPETLYPLRLEPVRASGTAGMVLCQQLGLPWRLLRDPRAIVLCPGFPPALPLGLFGGRVLPYIHDLFLLTRPQDLNRRAALYMRPAFRRAVATLPRFLANSEATCAALREVCRPDAEITLYRPTVRDVFRLGHAERGMADRGAGVLRLVALGTIEPRKNLRAAAAILSALRMGAWPGATLDIIGRNGWGEDARHLAGVPGVTLHGYQPASRVRELLAGADILLSTSHDEGLGLPLLEAQYGGLAVVAPDRPVFREVLGAGGTFIETADPAAAARRIEALCAVPDWRADAAGRARRNLARWNGLAERDRLGVIRLIGDLAAGA